MSKRKQTTEEDVLRIIRRDGRYGINLLMYRNKSKAKLLESMRKRGIVKRVNFKLNYTEFTIPESKDAPR